VVVDSGIFRAKETTIVSEGGGKTNRPAESCRSGSNNPST
jgi:hypothetical protein